MINQVIHLVLFQNTMIANSLTEDSSQLPQTSEHPLPPPSQPPAPEIFFGRDEYVSDMANLLAHNHNVRIAILGGGGMGKTSTALHILNHSEVKARYGDLRYFVGCDSVTSGGALALLILQIIRHNIAPNENSSDVLCRALSSYQCILLLLDNFETVWNAESNRADIRELLFKIVSISGVSLVITSRGDMPPSGVKWTHVDCLPPLSPGSAKDLFLDLHYGQTSELEGDHNLMVLLKELDYIPLAIH